MPRKNWSAVSAQKLSRRPTGSLADDAEAAYAAAAVLERLAMLTAEAAGVKTNSDVEHVHRMRVASRRLRTALRVFADCLPRRPLKAWQREARTVTRALGAARDLDVQLLFVAGFDTPRLRPRLRPGVRRLRLRLEQHRARLQPKVVRRIEEFEASGVAESMRDRLAVPAEPPPASPPLLRRGRDEITRHLDELLDLRANVDQPRRVHELHQMRIAAKHLRYSLEMFRPLFGDILKPGLATAKLIQQQLGDLHDGDVWREFLPGFAEDERERAIEYFGHDRAFRLLKPGLDYLLRRVGELRRGHYRGFRRTWHESEQAGTWEALRGSVALTGREGEP